MILVGNIKATLKNMMFEGFEVAGTFSNEYRDHLGFYGHHYLDQLPERRAKETSTEFSSFMMIIYFQHSLLLAHCMKFHLAYRVKSVSTVFLALSIRNVRFFFLLQIMEFLILLTFVFDSCNEMACGNSFGGSNFTLSHIYKFININALNHQFISNVLL